MNDFDNSQQEPENQLIGARIRNTVVERILSGHYQPGERLVELRLAKEFGTSQAPVREALHDLELSGLVTNRPRRGSFVNDYHARSQHEIYEVRGALEEAATRLALPRMKGNVADLEQHLEGMRRAAITRDLDGAARHSLAFHRAIMVASGNGLLLTMWEALHVDVHSRQTLLLPNIDFSAVAESHKPMIDAFVAMDVELACKLAREHQAYFEHQA